MIVYRGPSRLNGKRILVALTGHQGGSANRKTGSMAQSWILAEGEHPAEAKHSGEDAAVCGDCPLRSNGCYVTMMAPGGVWKRERGAPVEAPKRLVSLRIGAYGDPAAVPAAVWRRLVKAAGGRWTGYTHFWRKRNAHALRALCMASVETLVQARRAWSMGWRTYRIVPEGTKLEPNEIWCPYYTKGAQCIDCGLCNGVAKGHSTKSIAIPPHGPLRFKRIEVDK